MGINSTQVGFGFGQFGSTHITGDGGKVDLSGATSKYYVCAITITSNNTSFEALEILDGGLRMGMGNTACVSTEVINVGLAWGAVTAESTTTNADSLDKTADFFQTGTTLYGMWDKVELNGGSCIVYVAPRPDYIDRSAKLT